MLTISEAQYLTEKAICDKAYAYFRACADKRGTNCNFITKEEAEHPDYFSCNNDMRGRVEQYELNIERPNKFTAYVASNDSSITTWTGLTLGYVTRKEKRKDGKYSYWVRAIWGKTYYGFSNPSMAINLRETKN